MELLLHQWGDWPELYRNTDKTEATEIVIIDSQMNYRGKLDTYVSHSYTTTSSYLVYNKEKFPFRFPERRCPSCMMNR